MSYDLLSGETHNKNLEKRIEELEKENGMRSVETSELMLKYGEVLEKIAELRDKIDDVYSLHLNSKGMSIPEIDRHNHDIRDELNELKESNRLTHNRSCGNKEVLREFITAYKEVNAEREHNGCIYSLNIDGLLAKLDSGGEKEVKINQKNLGVLAGQTPAILNDSKPPEPNCDTCKSIRDCDFSKIRKRDCKQNNYKFYEPREDDVHRYPMLIIPFLKTTRELGYDIVKREDLVKWFKRIEHFLKVQTEGEIPLTLAYQRWKFELVKDEEAYGIE